MNLNPSFNTRLFWKYVRNASLLIALVTFSGAGFDYWQGLRSLGWQTVNGNISKNELKYLPYMRGQDRNVLESYAVLNFEYEYQVNGRSKLGHRIRMIDDQSENLQHYEQMKAKYPIGSKVNVYYDPRDPNRSCLVPGPNYENTLGLVVFGAIILGCSGATHFVSKLGQKLESE